MEHAWKKIFNSDLLRNASPIKGSIEGLSALSEHEVWLVTSRPKSTKNLTLSWLRDNNARYDHIVFDRRGNKLSVGPKFDVFVEDFVEEASTIAKAGILTLLFDQPWNNTDILQENCKRVYGWKEILTVISNLSIDQ
jgi:uncharacterized HAD superfamily protein